MKGQMNDRSFGCFHASLAACCTPALRTSDTGRESLPKCLHDHSALLKVGISVAAIYYRYAKQAVAAGIKPPAKAPMEGCARALQFVRSKATEWNFDKNRPGAAGGSAGACSSLWLAFHDDLADTKRKYPIARESTWLPGASVRAPQTLLDLHR